MINATTGSVLPAGSERIRLQTTVPAASAGEMLIVRGRHQEFRVRTSDFAVFDHLFTGAANRERMVTAPTVVWESKVPTTGDRR